MFSSLKAAMVSGALCQGSDQRPRIEQEVLPVFPALRKYRVFGSVCQELGTNICIFFLLYRTRSGMMAPLLRVGGGILTAKDSF